MTSSAEESFATASTQPNSATPFSEGGAPAPVEASSVVGSERQSEQTTSATQGAPDGLSGGNIRLVSNSEVQSFKRCRRKWALSYLGGWNKKEREVTGPLPFGTNIHSALERYYGHQEDPIQWWCHNTNYDINDAKQEKDFRLGRVMLDGYLDWVAQTGADEGIEVISAEEFVTVPFTTMMGMEVHLTGRLDVRIFNHKTSERTFFDHKTCQGLEPDSYRSEQLLTYDLIDAIRSEKHTLSGGTLNKLKKVLRTERAHPPFYDRQTQHHTDADLARHATRLMHTIQDMLELEAVIINNEQYFDTIAYPTRDRSCTWSCDYLTCCNMMDDGARWQDFLRDEYTQEPSDYTLRNLRDWKEHTSA